MTSTIATLADLLAPMTPEEFFASYHLKQPLHIPGTPEKFAAVMGWETLSDLLSRNALWTETSLMLSMDTHVLAPAEYCRPGGPAGGRAPLMADLEKVGQWLRRGASLVCNGIDSLTPPLKAVADALESGIGGKVQANLYCSWKEHPAFPSHFDTHDVYAVHVAGEKVWRIYERPIEDPISHPAYTHTGQEHFDRRKGPVTREVVMKPGDLLYLPRGWYHDALARSAGTMHVAFGLTSVIGLDLMALLFERAVHDPLFRRTVPDAGRDGEAAEAAHLAALGARLSDYVRDPATLEQWRRQVAAYRNPRPGLRLPDDATQRRWRRNRSTVRVVNRPGGPILSDGRKGVPIPPGMTGPVTWIVGRDAFDERDLLAAFPAMDGAVLRTLLRDLEAMTVVVSE